MFRLKLLLVLRKNDVKNFLNTMQLSASYMDGYAVTTPMTKEEAVALDQLANMEGLLSQIVSA